MKTSDKKRVLIIEDDVTLKTFLAGILYSVSPKVDISWYLTADEALWELSQLNPNSVLDYDLIISDIVTPGITDGIDVWKVCNRDYPSLPVVLTSGASFDEFIQDVSWRSGLPPFLPKPLKVESCKQIIHYFLDNYKRS
jgi:DNA-binding NtrC family response regulator